jgi:hypothetical protein
MKNWLDRIIATYLWVCDAYKKKLWVYCQRFTNHADLSFTDEEVMTIYLVGTMEGKRTKKQIYEHAKQYWHDLFPRLPSYVAFVQRINRLADVFPAFVEWLQGLLPKALFSQEHYRLMDSMPVILAQRGRRFHAKVAPELADKNGYCATKKLHYYGVKLHLLGSAQSKTLPIPDLIGITPAGMSDVKAYEAILPAILPYEKFADKAYLSETTRGTKTYTPVKKRKGQAFLEAADQLYSTAISKIRQPIESCFHWIEEKVNIQIASKVRSYNGLMVHIFGKLTVMFSLLLDKFSS